LTRTTGLAQRLQQRAKGLRFHARHHAALGPDRQDIDGQVVRVTFAMWRLVTGMWSWISAEIMVKEQL
jgi:hypothetical protein